MIEEQKQLLCKEALVWMLNVGAQAKESAAAGKELPGMTAATLLRRCQNKYPGKLDNVTTEEVDNHLDEIGMV